MPYFATSQEWLRQSALLFEARPTTVSTYAPMLPRRDFVDFVSKQGCDGTSLLHGIKCAPSMGHDSYAVLALSASTGPATSRMAGASSIYQRSETDHTSWETQTRVTTKYSITKPKPRKSKDAAAETPSTTKPPRGDLTVKTYDPVSGTTLKYRTTKAAEVGRLVLCLGRLGTRMTGAKGDPADVEIAAPATALAPAAGEDVVMGDERATTPVPPAAAAAGTAADTSKTPAAGGGGGGGKGKKKKGKK